MSLRLLLIKHESVLNYVPNLLSAELLDELAFPDGNIIKKMLQRKLFTSLKEKFNVGGAN